MGWRSKEERDLSDWAQKRGWRASERNKAGHLVLIWPLTGVKMPIAGSIRSHTIVNARKQIQRAELVMPTRRKATAIDTPASLNYRG